MVSPTQEFLLFENVPIEPRCLPTPHGDKLVALLNNDKLPAADIPRIKAAQVRYRAWLNKLQNLPDKNLLDNLVSLVNEYKNYIEYEVIFCAEDDFLHRQKGQIKLDNTVLEEFLPYLWDVRLVKAVGKLRNTRIGPLSCYAGMSFGKSNATLNDGGVYFKTKDQDFAVAEEYELQLSKGTVEYKTKIHVAHFAAELKTYLDKTMFQEASTTSTELKHGASTSKYILVCESINMSVVEAETRNTNIDEVIILRKAKRPRSHYPSGSRIEYRSEYLDYLMTNPLSKSGFERILYHLNHAFPESTAISEEEILVRGYF